jgi:hypothetical protein
VTRRLDLGLLDQQLDLVDLALDGVRLLIEAREEVERGRGWRGLPV